MAGNTVSSSNEEENSDIAKVVNYFANLQQRDKNIFYTNDSETILHLFENSEADGEILLSYGENSTPFALITIGDVRGNMHIIDTELRLSEKGANSQSNKFPPKGAICVTCIASPGLVGFATENSQTNQQLNSIVCKKRENEYYLYFYLTDYFNFSKAKTGNTFANMNKGDFSSIKILLPQKVLIEFRNKLKSSIDNILMIQEPSSK